MALAWILAAALAVSGCATSGAATSATAAPPGADLEAVMEAIQQALSEAQLADVPGFPPLESVTLKLQTEASKSVGGEIALYVFAIGSKYTSETASTLELTLKPADTRPVPDVLLRTYECPEDGPVDFYVVEGGGHSWPGSAFSEAIVSIVGPTNMELQASELIWDFLSRYRLPEA